MLWHIWAMTEVVRFRVDAELKTQAQQIVKEIGLDLSGACVLFLTQLVRRREIPFPLKAAEDNSDVLIPMEMRARVADIINED